MPRTRKTLMMLVAVCLSCSAAVASQLIGGTATNRAASDVSPEAAVCMIEHHFQFHKIVQPFGLHTLAPPLRTDPCGTAP
jgi:hypothetical protein